MLAASPSQSPKNLHYSSPSNNGPLSTQSHISYQSSPRFASPSSRSSNLRSTDKITEPQFESQLRPSARSYVDASTQFSPMSRDLNASSDVSTTETAGTSQAVGQDAPLPVNGPSVSVPISQEKAAVVPSSSVSLTPIQSPNTKRRQFKDVTEPGIPSASMVSPASVATKRAKPARPAAKVLPIKYEHCEVDDIVVLIADMISELIETNDNLPLQDVVLTRFHSRQVISLGSSLANVY